MWHTKFRSIVLASLPVCAAMAAGALVLGGHRQNASALAERTAPASSVADGRYCYNWDFFNTSGSDANDLHFTIKGVSTVGTFYTGAMNPFGQPDATSGYDAESNSYVLNFSNGIAYNGEKVHIGLCTNTPALNVDDAYWTADGQPVGSAPHRADLRFNWLTPNQLRVELTNPLPFTATVWVLNVLQPEQPMVLDDLNGEIAAQLPMITEAITEPITLSPHGTFAFDLSLSQASHAYGALLNADQALIVEAMLSPEDDPDNTVHLVAQTLGTLQRVHLPLVQR